MGSGRAAGCSHNQPTLYRHQQSLDTRSNTEWEPCAWQRYFSEWPLGALRTPPLPEPPSQACIPEDGELSRADRHKTRSVGVSLLEVRKTRIHITEHLRLVEKSRTAKIPHQDYTANLPRVSWGGPVLGAGQVSTYDRDVQHMPHSCTQ